MNRQWALLLWLGCIHAEYTIYTVTCSGILTNRETYKRLYGLERNDAFTHELHERGLDAIKKELSSQGYLNAHVSGTVTYHESDFTVDVQLSIKHGNRYTIDQVRAEPALDEAAADPVIFEKIKRMMAKYVLGTYYTREALDKRINRVHDHLIKKGYLNPTITTELIPDHDRSAVAVIFRCGLKHKREMLFSGNNFFSTRHLYDCVQQFGPALTVVPGSIIADTLSEQYHHAGFFDVVISVVTAGHETSGNGLHFFIKEGNRAVLAAVHIRAEGLDPTQHRWVTRAERLLIKKKYYDDEAFNAVLQDCVTSLTREGFWHARVADVSWHAGDRGYSIEITLDCGTQQCMNTCTVEECPDDIHTSFQYHFKKKSLDAVPIDSYLLANMRKFLQKELQKKGYLYKKVNFELRNEPNGTTTLLWKCEGPDDPVRFGPTRVKGVRCVPEHIVRRELWYQQGDVWSNRARDATVQALRNLGIFDSVTLFPDDITICEDEKLMILQCRESDPFELKARAGFQGVGTNLTWQGGATYKFGGTFLWKNPTAHADILTLHVDITRFMRNFTGTYQLPWLGPLPVRNQYKAYSVRYDQPIVVGSRDILYRFSQDGFLCALSRQFPVWQWGATSGIEWLRVDDLSANRARAIDFTVLFIHRKIPYWFGEISFFINAVDNRLDPVSGSSTLVSCKLQVPLTVSCASAAKFFIEQSGYIPISREHHVVLALRLRCGLIAYQEFNRIMPPERFYLGGAYSLRGYQPDLAPPLNIYHDSDGQLCYVPTGGKSMVNSNIELRFPVYKALSGAAFIDLGLLTQKTFTAVTAGDLLAAVGWGVRWNTPLGPLRFDIGWRLRDLPDRNGAPCQAPYVWFLTVGNAF